jgi:thiamine transport system permease protein
LALALARRRFVGRGLIVRALGASMAFPSIAAIFAIVAAYGRSGYLARALEGLGVAPSFSLYGLPGILLAHVFFNAPFAARLYLSAVEATPAAQIRLAASLGFRPRDVFRRLDAPALARATPPAAGLIFLLCATSFAPVLALGGGPGAATLEVAIYQALRYDFDLSRAATLSLAQVALAGAALTLAARRGAAREETPEATRRTERPDVAALSTWMLDAFAFALSGLVMVAPLVALVASSITADFGGVLSDEAFGAALTGSLAIAAPASAIAFVAGLSISVAAARLGVTLGRPRIAEAVAGGSALILAVPPFALATGLFIAVRGAVTPAQLGAPLVALVNALTALPFATRLLRPPLETGARRYDRLAASLGVIGWARLARVEAPALRRPAAQAIAFALSASLGDFGVAALFGHGQALTLPVLLYGYLGSYQTDKAAAVTILLLALVAGVFIVSDLIAGGRDG